MRRESSHVFCFWQKDTATMYANSPAGCIWLVLSEVEHQHNRKKSTPSFQTGKPGSQPLSGLRCSQNYK